MYPGKKIWAILLFSWCTALSAQQTSVFSDANASYKRGVDFYERGLPAQARREFQETIDLLLPVNEASAEMLRTRAHLYLSKCSVEMESRDGERNTLAFIRETRPDPEYKLALADLGDYYFNTGKYKEALTYFSQLPASGLPKKQSEQVSFRRGYAHFVLKQYPQAKPFFETLKNEKSSPYFAPANYYLGFCLFNEGNYNQAYQALTAIENEEAYSQELPYLQGQILFAQRRFPEVVQKLQAKANDPRVANRKEINQLVGQSLFEMGRFRESLPYLENYAAASSKLREEELYQLGFAQYQEKKYQAAIGNFRPLSSANSIVGQNAMFYLANCYLQTGDKNGAFNALGSAKRMAFDPALQEEASFNYAKLAYELNQPREAANELKDFKPGSRFYNESQALLGDVLLSFRDYRQAFEIADGMYKTNRTPQFIRTYQKIALGRGIQVLLENNPDGAKPFLQKATENPADPTVEATAFFWLGDIANRKGQYQESIANLSKFLLLARSLNNLPEETGVFAANYIQGYNYLKTGQYELSRNAFQVTVDGILRNKGFIRNTDISVKMLGDATLRLGDSYFRANQYEYASQNYKRAIDNKYAGYDYAIFQNAIIAGLQGKKIEEILALEQLVRDFQNSQYADDALFQIGFSYQNINKNAQAADAFNSLVKNYRNKSPLVNPALLQLGLISYNMTKYDNAIDYFKQVLSNNPEAEEAGQALQNIEYLYVEVLGQPDKYIEYRETIPNYKTENVDRDALTYKTAQSQFEKADYQRAIESFSNYIRNFPKGINIISAYFNRGDCYSIQKQYARALADYEAAIAYGNSKVYVKALEKAAVIAYNQELDFAKAFRYYSELEKVATTEDLIFSAQLGALRSAYKTKNTNAVYALADKVIKNPKAAKDQIATANFFLGKLAFDKEDFGNALPALERVILMSNNEQSDEARYLQAYIYYRRKDLKKASDLCIESNSKNASNPYWAAKSILLLADILVEQDELYEAEAALELLIENYSGDKDLLNQASTRLGQVKRLIDEKSRLNKTGGN